MSKLKVFVHPVKKEFQREKCGFNHIPADVFIRSQWQRCTKSSLYLIYRWAIALFFTGVVIESMIDSDTEKNFWLYFIYMTNWGVMMCMITNLLCAVLVTIYFHRPEYADKLLNMKSLASPFRIYWGLHIITLVGSIVITIIYWSILYKANTSILNATNILTHAFNSICMFIDLLIVAHPLRLLHVFLPLLFGIVYSIFSYIYQMCGGVNQLGQPFIYYVLDWSDPANASVTVIGVLMLTCCVYSFLFLIYKIRLLVHRQLTHKTAGQSTTSCGPSGKSTNHLKMGKNEKPAAKDDNGIQHTPTGISMVLGNYRSYENQSFANSSENIGQVR